MFVTVLTHLSAGHTNRIKEDLENELALNIIGLYELSGFAINPEWITNNTGIMMAARYSREHPLSLNDNELDAVLKDIFREALKSKSEQ